MQGKAEKPAYIFINEDDVEIRDASHLWGMTTFAARDTLKAELGRRVGVLTIGPAAENLVVFSTLLADEGSSASGGLGSVMGSKNLKAICVAGSQRPSAAEPARLSDLARHIRRLTLGPSPQMWWMIPGVTRAQICPGCGIGCWRHAYTGKDGRVYKSNCQAIDVYRRPAQKYHDGWNDVILYAMRLCDGYGLDSSVMQGMIEWLNRFCKEGILSEADTGLPLSKIGDTEFIETLTRMITMREGFGEMLARGTIHAAESIGGRAKELINGSVMNRTNEIKDYDPRLILHNALLIATEPRRPLQQVHEASSALITWLEWLDGSEGVYLSSDVLTMLAERCWGSAAAADYSIYDGKAVAARIIQDRAYAIESMVLCNARWPILHHPATEDHLGDLSLPARIFSAITGRDMDEVGLYLAGERNVNLQRAVLLREGWGGREGDRLLDYYHEEPLEYVRFDRECHVPGKNGEVASRKGRVIYLGGFEKIKDEYYRLRGWAIATGLPTGARLRQLQLNDVY